MDSVAALAGRARCFPALSCVRFGAARRRGSVRLWCVLPGGQAGLLEGSAGVEESAAAVGTARPVWGGDTREASRAGRGTASARPGQGVSRGSGRAARPLPRGHVLVTPRQPCAPFCTFVFPQAQPPAGGHAGSATPPRKAQSAAPKVRRSVSSRVHEAVRAIALCHNVTPVYEPRAGAPAEAEDAEADQDFSDGNRTYQAASPDEVSRGLSETLRNQTASEARDFLLGG